MAIEDDDPDELAGLPDFLRDPIGIPKRHWLPMLVAVILGIVATAVAVVRWEPVYVATATLLVARQQIPESFVKTTVEEDPFAQLNRMVGEVLSRARLADIISAHDLYPDTREVEGMNAVIGIVRGTIELKNTQQFRGPRSRAPTSAVYLLQFEYRDPTIAADVANSLARLFLEAGIKGRMQQAGDISKFLQDELRDSEREVGVQDAKIAEFKQQYRGELPSELGSNLARLQRLQDQRQSIAIQIGEAETRIATMAATSVDPGSPRARLSLLRALLETELAIYTPEHPNVIALQRQVEALEARLANADDSGAGDSIDALIAASRMSLSRQREELQRTEAEILDLDARVARTPKRQEELDALERIASVKRDRYLDMMNKVENATLAEDLETSKHGANISIMDRAHPPAEPKRARIVVAIAGLIGMLGLAGGAGLLFELLDPVMVDRDQTERISGVPVLGSIPRIS